MELLLLTLNLLLIIAILLFLTNFIFAAIRYVPFVPSKRKAIEKMLEVANIRSGQTIYDLGCGDGRLLIIAEQKYGAQSIGYEAALSVYLLARLRKFLSRSKATISPQNFFKANIADADIVFCYLFPHVMNKLKEKFERELKPGTRVISNSFAITGWTPTHVAQTYADKTDSALIRVYEMGKSNVT